MRLILKTIVCTFLLAVTASENVTSAEKQIVSDATNKASYPAELSSVLEKMAKLQADHNLSELEAMMTEEARVKFASDLLCEAEFYYDVSPDREMTDAEKRLSKKLTTILDVAAVKKLGLPYPDGLYGLEALDAYEAKLYDALGDDSERIARLTRISKALEEAGIDMDRFTAAVTDVKKRGDIYSATLSDLPEAQDEEEEVEDGSVAETSGADSVIRLDVELHRFAKVNGQWKWDGFDEEGIDLLKEQAANRMLSNVRLRGKTVTGEEIDLKSLRGKYVLIDFWGTWCGPCVAALPKLKMIHEKMPNFEIIGVAGDSKRTLKKFLEKNELPWGNILDPESEIAGLFGVSAFPTTLLIDPSGENIAQNPSGFELVQQLIKGMDLDSSDYSKLLNKLKPRGKSPVENQDKPDETDSEDKARSDTSTKSSLKDELSSVFKKMSVHEESLNLSELEAMMTKRGRVKFAYDLLWEADYYSDVSAEDDLTDAQKQAAKKLKAILNIAALRKLGVSYPDDVDSEEAMDSHEAKLYETLGNDSQRVERLIAISKALKEVGMQSFGYAGLVTDVKKQGDIYSVALSELPKEKAVEDRSVSETSGADSVIRVDVELYRFVKENGQWKCDGFDDEGTDLLLDAGSNQLLSNVRLRGKTVTGKEIDLKSLRGKYVLIDFWGTWCKPCVAALPKLKMIHEEMPNFEIIGVAGDDKKTLEKFFEKTELPWPNIVDPDLELADLFGVSAFPTMLLIDPSGENVARDHAGVELVEQLIKGMDLDRNDYSELLQQLQSKGDSLAETKVSPDDLDGEEKEANDMEVESSLKEELSSVLKKMSMLEEAHNVSELEAMMTKKARIEFACYLLWEAGLYYDVPPEEHLTAEERQVAKKLKAILNDEALQKLGLSYPDDLHGPEALDAYDAKLYEALGDDSKRAERLAEIIKALEEIDLNVDRFSEPITNVKKRGDIYSVALPGMQEEGVIEEPSVTETSGADSVIRLDVELYRFIKVNSQWKWDGYDDEGLKLLREKAANQMLANIRLRGKTVTGEEVDLKSLRGKYVLIDFWGTWCGPCVAALPKLKMIHEKMPNFEIIGVAGDSKRTLNKFFEKTELPWANILDPESEIAGLFGVSAFPTTLLIDPSGENVARDPSGVELVEELIKRMNLDSSEYSELINKLK